MKLMILKDLLHKLNKENYSEINLKSNDIVSHVERILFKIEFELLNSSKIQKCEYREYKKFKYYEK